jgi:electron transfer flavoprotein-quinone oxidoreductase
MEEKFDAIVVGAGPAGCSCAYRLARAGLQVLIVERGKVAGAKNMWGGALYGPALRELLPNFWEEAPFERYITRRKISALSEDAAVTLELTTPESGQVPHNGITLLRSKFDRWLAAEVEKVGAIVATGLQADDLVWDEEQVVGVVAGGDAVRGDVVIACDGVNSILAQKAGLRGELKSRDIKQGVKEVLELPRDQLEQRFGVSGDDGVAWEFVGSFTGGIPGGGFIYTNKDTLSVGIVAHLGALAEEQVKADDLLEDFKKHPVVTDLISGGNLVEYSAHLLPISGIAMMPKLYGNGLLVAGDAAGLVAGTGLILEGANFAIASGVAAAETIVRARQEGDFSNKSLRYYQKLLEQSFVLRDLKTFRRAPHFLENARIYSVYPKLVCDLASRVLMNDGAPRKRFGQLVRELTKGKVSLWQIGSDLIRGARAI